MYVNQYLKSIIECRWAVHNVGYKMGEIEKGERGYEGCVASEYLLVYL